ncbi:MAG: aspartate-semialdehyde dehydrogenase [SAR202 cluster bacterium]|nr:aspartate-semialdehyde dehydrogenase [SAR202 cluster bacterium]MQF93567.1 aspartate-semialdehyde dehydrogenase [SAR202 cluster bacterium]|tara:strand:+ start:1181 stop:2200 length:1020 start_codon:yes stop_codon:yes gene_type:complete
MDIRNANIGIIGSTGAVGVEALKLLSEIAHPADKIQLFASERSKGKKVPYLNRELIVKTSSDESFKEIDVGLISVSSEVSKELAPQIVKNGGVVIDDGSAYRMEKNVPLVVPEINETDLEFHEGIISIPNCTTTPLVMVIDAINSISKVGKVVVSTYQAVSGTGKEAVNELINQQSGDQSTNVYDFPIANNIFPHVDDFMPDGFTKEEHKMINESKKILHDNEIEIIPTCVRVPVKIGHSESLTITLKEEISLEDIKKVVSEYSGITLLNQSDEIPYPMPLFAEGKKDVFVGRIRKSLNNSKELNLWLSCDNLIKGAAYNALQILESMIKKDLIKLGKG